MGILGYNVLFFGFSVLCPLKPRSVMEVMTRMEWGKSSLLHFPSSPVQVRTRKNPTSSVGVYLPVGDDSPRKCRETEPVCDTRNME